MSICLSMLRTQKSNRVQQKSGPGRGEGVGQGYIHIYIKSRDALSKFIPNEMV